MLIDSGDYFYLPKGMSGGASYNSPEYMEMNEALKRPNGLEELAERIAQDKFDPKIIRVESSGFEFDSNESNRALAEMSRQHWLEAHEQYPQLYPDVPATARDQFKKTRIEDIETRVVCFEQCGRSIRELGYSLESGRVKSVLTYHSTFRFGKASDDIYAPDPGLGETFDMYLVPNLVNFNLPEEYEPDKARLYLQIVKGLQDPERIEQVLSITGGVHGVMKLAIQGTNEDRLPFGNELQIRASDLEEMLPNTVETVFKHIVESVRKNNLRWE